MSNTPESEFDLERHFLPAWATESTKDRYAQFEGESRWSETSRRPQRDGGDRNRDRQRRPPPQDGRGPRPAGSAPRFGDGQRRSGPDRDRGFGGHRLEHENRRPEPAPVPDLVVTFKPDEAGVDSLARQIRITGRSYALFDIAQMILAKPERHSVTFAVKKNPEGKPIQPLFVCALDDSPWLSEDEAVRYVLDKHFALFYQANETKIEPPKGVYTFVAQCGLSGVILGPPNYHDYQNQLRRVHQERFPRMPFDRFKARVKITKDEAVVKKWIEEQSVRTEFDCLNVPEPKRLVSRQEVEKHFREVHLGNIIKSIDHHTMPGGAGRTIRSSELLRLLRLAWEDQKRFPLQIATVLSQQFATRGLQFFKVNRTVTHVCIARPNYLDLEAIPVSDGIRRIVEFIQAHPKGSAKQMIHALAPRPAPSPGIIPIDPPAATAPGATPTPTASAPAIPPPVSPSPEEAAIMTDLHWLVQQGHVIEFANGVLETAKKPLPRPPKPEPKAEPKSAHPSVAKTDVATGNAASVAASGPVEAAPPEAVSAADPVAENALSETAHATEGEHAPVPPPVDPPPSPRS